MKKSITYIYNIEMKHNNIIKKLSHIELTKFDVIYNLNNLS